MRSSDADPYTQAEASLKDSLIKQGCTVRAMTAKEASDKGIDSSIGRPIGVVAIGTPAARWLHRHLPADVKLVYCMVTGPEEAGLLEGHDVWGVTTEVPISEQFKLIAEAIPRVRSIGVLYQSDTPLGLAMLARIRSSLPADWRCEPVAVNEFPSVSDAIESLVSKRIDLIWTAPDAKLFDTAAVRSLLLSSVRKKIPVWGFSPQFVRAGALLGIGVEPQAQGRQAADLLIAILADRNATHDKPRARGPDGFQIAVNLLVARQLDIEMPESISRRATFVYRPER